MRRRVALVVFAAVILSTWSTCVEAEQPVDERISAQSNGPCVAADVLVSQGWAASGVGQFYYGGAEWPQMTAAVSAVANSVTVTANLEDLADLLQYDALWIDQRDRDDGGYGPGELTPNEAANVLSFIATARRVVIFGENPWWTDWNNQILSLVGGTFAGEVTTWTLDAVTVHELTDGVSSVYVNAGGYCTGGTSLFTRNFATLWSGDSVLTLLDVNFISIDYWNHLDNLEFGNNIAQWIGCKSPLIADTLFVDGFESGGTAAWSTTAG